METLKRVRRHNRAFKQLLHTINDRVDAAESEQQLIHAIELAIQFNAPLRYDNDIFHYSMAACTGVVFGLITKGIAIDQAPPAPWMVILVVAAVSCLVMLVFVLVRNGRLGDLSDRISLKDALLDNNLRRLRINKKAKAREFARQFNEFDRGNYKREIEELYYGHYQGKEESFQYQYFHFHYVNRRVETYTKKDSKGRTSTHTRVKYDHYHRYGIICKFGYVRDVNIYSEWTLRKGKHRYKPASNRFNNQYKAYGDSEQTLAKFLKPAVVLTLEELGNQLGGINIEFNQTGKLCLSFSDSDLLKPRRQHGLQEPTAFREEIAGHSRLDKLSHALASIDTLVRHSDSNFKEAAI